MMKLRNIFFLTAAFALLFSACNNDDDDPTATSNLPITLDCVDISSDMVFKNNPDAPVDYIVPCLIRLESSVSIEPGTVIKFQSDAGFIVEDNGQLNATGTAAEPIILEGETAAKGSWRGVMFYSNNVNNRLEHVVVRHAGGNSFNSNNDRGNVVVFADARLALHNSTIEMGAEYGLNLDYSSAKLDFSSNTINNCNQAPVRIPASLASELDAASTYTGNGRQYLEIGTDNLTGSHTWVNCSIPFQVVDNSTHGTVQIEDQASLTINPGSRVEFAADLGLEVKDGGLLKVIGTSDNSITLTGSSAAAGAWKGVICYSNHVQNEISYTELSYAGSGAFNSNGDVGTIILWADARLKVNNSTLRDGDGSCGIVDVYTNSILDEHDNTFINVGTNICN